MDSSFQLAAWLGWVKKLPDALIRARPLLSIEVAQALTNAGEIETADSRLQDAERWVDAIGTMRAKRDGSSDLFAIADETQIVLCRDIALPVAKLPISRRCGPAVK